MRLKFPAGYQIPPHIHPKPEVVRTLHFGEGETVDKGKTKALRAGSFFAMPPGMKHYAYADEELFYRSIPAARGG